MKPALILSLAVFLLVSCRSNYTTYEYAPLNSVIKRYSFEYYMLPENIGKVIQYLERLKRESPDTYYYSEPYLEEDLADCYRSTLDLCLENEIKSVAFCCISTGVFHFPNRRAAEIAVQTVTDWMDQHPGQMERIIFNVFKEEDKIYYEAEIQ